MILFIGLAVLAAATGQSSPQLCDPQCNIMAQSPWVAVPTVSICVSAEAGQLHDYLAGTSKEKPSISVCLPGVTLCLDVRLLSPWIGCVGVCSGSCPVLQVINITARSGSRTLHP